MSGGQATQRRLKIALVYDCLYPHTVGGVERWYRCLADRLSANDEVTYLTRRQWVRGEKPDEAFALRALAPGLPMYTRSGRRSIVEALVWAAGVFLHLLRHGRSYDIVHTATAPYLSLVAAWLGLRLSRSRAKLVVDWFEVWGREYWVDYLGSVGGRIGHMVERACMRMGDLNFTFSDLHAARLQRDDGDGRIERLTGLYEGSTADDNAGTRDARLIVFAGRHIPEKRVRVIPAAIAQARESVQDVRCVIFGDGPDSMLLANEVARLGLDDVIELRGKVSAEEVARTISTAACLLLPSEREGYGLVVVEAVAKSTPVIVVRARDNAAPELVENGVNGLVADSPAPEVLGAAIVRVLQSHEDLVESTGEWYQRNAARLSVNGSVEAVERSYRLLAEPQARR